MNYEYFIDKSRARCRHCHKFEPIEFVQRDYCRKKFHKEEAEFLREPVYKFNPDISLVALLIVALGFVLWVLYLALNHYLAIPEDQKGKVALALVFLFFAIASLPGCIHIWRSKQRQRKWDDQHPDHVAMRQAYEHSNEE